MTLSCPLCGHAPSVRLYEVADAAGAHVPLHACERCHAQFAAWPQRPGTAEQVVAHDTQWPSLSADEAAELRAGCVGIVHSLAPLLPAPDAGLRVFEIGSGRGGLLAAFRDEGYDVLGCEASEHLCALASGAYGLEGRILREEVRDFLPRIAAHRGPRAVVLWHVLEHLVDAGEVWAGLAAVLGPGDVVAVQLPTPVARWVYPEHLFFPTEETLRWLAARHGYRVESLAYDHALDFVSAVFRRDEASRVEAAGWRDERYRDLSRELAEAREAAAERLERIEEMDAMVRERDALLAVLKRRPFNGAAALYVARDFWQRAGRLLGRGVDETGGGR